MPIEPIEMEFLLRENLTEGSTKAASAAEVLGRTAAGMAEKIKEQIREHKGLIRDTEADLRRLEKQLKGTAPGKEYAELAAEVSACQKALDEERQILSALEAQHEATSGGLRKLTKEQRLLTEAMAQMRLNRQQNSQEYAILAARAAELADTIGDVRQETHALAHDDSGLQGLISGISGLSGAITAATGIMGIFISEEEELAKMQTRLQSVMSITMGLQQVMNTLNEDSAFKLVALKRAKEWLTVANQRLAVSLGISTTAATALMAALSLGITLIVTAGIAAYNRYADAKEAARKKSEELLAVEKTGRAEALRTRFELDNVARGIKTFNGTKEEEKRKVNELNSKYGETFGYYKTMAEWYDVLTKKSEDYIEVLFLEHKVRSLIDKAVEADEELNKVKAKPVEDYSSVWDYWSSSLVMQDGGDFIDPRKMAEETRDKAIAEAQGKVDALKAEAKALQDKIAEKKKSSDLGDHVDPEEEKRKKDEERRKAEARIKERTEGRKKIADVEQGFRKEGEDAKITAIEDEFERERKTLETNYQRKRDEIEREERSTLELIAEMRRKGHTVDPSAETKVTLAKTEALVALAAAYSAEVDRINDKEAKKKKDELDELLEKHRDFDAQRRAIEAEYAEYVEKLGKLRTEDNAAEVDAAIAQARRGKDSSLKEVNEKELEATKTTSEFLVRLFQDAGEKSTAEIKRIISETEALMEYLKTTATEDITSQQGISAERLRILKDSPDDLKSMQEALTKLKGEVAGRSPFDAFFMSVKKGLDSIKKGGKDNVAQGITSIAGAVQQVLPEVQELGHNLSAIFGDRAGEDIEIITGLIGGLGDAASGVGRLMAGDVLGGIQGVVSGVSSILSMGAKASAAHREALKAIADAQREFERRYTLILMKQRLMLEEASTPFGEDKVRKAANALKVLADAHAEYQRRLKGDDPKKNPWYHSLFGRMLRETTAYKREVEAYQSGIGALAEAKIVTGRRKTGLFGWGKGEDTYSSILSVYPKLIKATGELDTAMLREIINTRKMSDEHKRMLESILESEEVMQEAMKQFDAYLQESFGSLGASMSSALATSLREGRDALEVFAEDAASTLERMGEQMAYSLFFADRFATLQKQLKSIYQATGDPKKIAYDVKNLLSSFMSQSKNSIEEASEMMKAYKASAAEAGFKLWGNDGVEQSAKAGAFTTMTQEQGTKLEGLFTSGQVHWAGIDDKMEGVTLGLSRQLDALSLIARHTAPIIEIHNELQNIKRDGIKIK